jgi:hypothetical protein
MPEVTTKKVVLSQILEDLKSGLTKWKKDDIGFGSLEKKYNLQNSEMIELLGHPVIKNVETRIPTFVIVDDVTLDTPVTTTIEIGIQAKQNGPSAVIAVERPEPKERKKIEAFI